MIDYHKFSIPCGGTKYLYSATTACREPELFLICGSKVPDGLRSADHIVKAALRTRKEQDTRVKIQDIWQFIVLKANVSVLVAVCNIFWLSSLSFQLKQTPPFVFERSVHESSFLGSCNSQRRPFQTPFTLYHSNYRATLAIRKTDKETNDIYQSINSVD